MLISKNFITDLRIVKNGGKPDFKHMVQVNCTTKCRKSLCWTNKTRKSINYKWMQEEAKDKNILLSIILKSL